VIFGTKRKQASSNAYQLSAEIVLALIGRDEVAAEILLEAGTPTTSPDVVDMLVACVLSLLYAFSFVVVVSPTYTTCQTLPATTTTH